MDLESDKLFDLLGPSIIIAYNLSPDTYTFKEDIDRAVNSFTITSPLGTHGTHFFYKKEEKEGELPKILQILMRQRKLCKDPLIKQKIRNLIVQTCRNYGKIVFEQRGIYDDPIRETVIYIAKDVIRTVNNHLEKNNNISS
jgi:DNA polymerase elongation subunit (family B)